MPLLCSVCILLSSVAFCFALPDSIWRISSPSRVQSQLQTSFRQLYPHISQGKINVWEVVQLAVLGVLVPCLWYWKSNRAAAHSVEISTSGGTCEGKARKKMEIHDTEDVDPGLLKKHSEIRSFTTTQYTYPSLRIFHHKHPQFSKASKSTPSLPEPLPLLVFIHGLGGSVLQFQGLLTSLVNLADVLAIDLPGCGMSSFSLKSWDAYKTDALAELLATIIEEYRDKEQGQGVVLIGHSMGCSLAAILASKTPTPTPLSENIVGLVAICPKAEPPNEQQTAQFRNLLWVPNLIFDSWRRWDRRGGVNSPSVQRFVGADADLETKKLQERFNSQSRTAVWRRMASGSLPSFKNGKRTGGLPGEEVWAGLECPVFLVAGEDDQITKPSELVKISAFLGKSHPIQIELDDHSKPIVDAAAPVDITNDAPAPDPDAQSGRSGSLSTLGDSDTLNSTYDDPSTPNEDLSFLAPLPRTPKPRRVLKTTILPAPASHALLYMPSTVRILSGLISDFLATQVSPRLSLGWQLQFLSTSGKWDVKNLAKWQAVTPVGEPVAGIFRAMKTLREVDERHSPEVFVKEWGYCIKDVVDISHESPVYDPRGLEAGGIHYTKFPTVSKIPPTGDEVDAFITLIDRLVIDQRERAAKEGWEEGWCIGVHCHYGFNRTGYFIVCYLVERCGYTVQGAIDEFARKRGGKNGKGIKHAHFLDQLFVRYCVGLKRAPTL